MYNLIINASNYSIHYLLSFWNHLNYMMHNTSKEKKKKKGKSPKKNKNRGVGIERRTESEAKNMTTKPK